MLLPAFTCAREIDSFGVIYLGVDILRPFPCFDSYLDLDTIVL